LNILFIGNVFGQPGREVLLRWLPGFRAERAVDFVIANGENVANGAGITCKLALKLLGGGVDVLTTGNQVRRELEVQPFLATDKRIVRPADYPPPRCSAHTYSSATLPPQLRVFLPSLQY
jgi:calcineurin-like phosphoesterase